MERKYTEQINIINTTSQKLNITMSIKLKGLRGKL